MFSRLTTLANLIARSMAIAGGGVLIALVAMTCLSIAGRALVPLGLQPIKGDFELLEIGVGFAVFAFLPWCQLERGHALVDLLKPVYPALINRLLDALADLGMLAAMSLIAWRLWAGMLDKMRFGETTFILQIPVWAAYAAGLSGAVAAVLVALYCCLRSSRRVLGIRESEPAK